MADFRPSRFEILPIVIKNLLIINVLFFLAQKTFEASGINLEDYLGLHHVKSPLFQPWQLVTHLFLHGSIGHLASNMFAFWMFGTHLEALWGPKRFLTFYFLCGIGAGLIQLAFLWYDYHALLNEFLLLKQHLTPSGVIDFLGKYGVSNNPNNTSIINSYISEPDNSNNISGVVQVISETAYRIVNNATIGASGAVFGILAAFVYLFPNTNLYLLFIPIPIKAKWVGLAYFGFEIYSGILNSSNDNIAHWAHIGGGLVGFLLVLNWNKKNRRTFY